MDIESKKELKDTELEKAAAGDIIDDVKCLFCGHKYKPDGEKTTRFWNTMSCGKNARSAASAAASG